MTAGRLSTRLMVFGAALLIGVPLGAAPAEAARQKSNTASARSNARVIQTAMASSSARHGGWSRAARFGRVGGGLQCVPFARENSGIELSGNAGTWWANAEGVYERGARPEVGSVLNFRANGRMRMGHVAVVANVINGRTIEIDHANWGGPGAGRGSVTRNITVVDVSERNDWSAVRVALGHTEDYGSVYPTYGFIYDRPDRGTMLANNAAAAPAPVLNAPPRDLRPAAERLILNTAPQEAEEVAEAADEPAPRYTRRGAVHQVRNGRAAPHSTTRLAAAASRSTTRLAAAAPRGKAVTVVRVHSTRQPASPAGHQSRRHRL